MAKIVFTLEDMPDGVVKTTLQPTAETLLRKIASHGPESLTSAEGYAMFLVNRLREEGKRKTGQIIVPVQRVRGRSL